MKPGEVVTKYNDCINRRDIDGLAKLTDNDYVFIDTAETKISGKRAGIETWKGFFRQFPDYKNEFEQIKDIGDNTVIIVGKSVCSFEPLNGPALWRAAVKNDKVREWQVYEDTAANRKKLGIS